MCILHISLRDATTLYTTVVPHAEKRVQGLPFRIKQG